jgi:hypothetical protein
MLCVLSGATSSSTTYGDQLDHLPRSAWDSRREQQWSRRVHDGGAGPDFDHPGPLPERTVASGLRQLYLNQWLKLEDGCGNQQNRHQLAEARLARRG